MSDDRFMRIHSPEFQAMAARVLRATELTSRLNVLPFDDEAGRAELLAQLLGRPLPARVTIYPPFYTDHGLNLEIAERVFINQNCTFLDYAGIRLGEGVMIGPKATFITLGHPVDPVQRREWLTGAPIHVGRTPGSALARRSSPASVSAATPWWRPARWSPTTSRPPPWSPAPKRRYAASGDPTRLARGPM